MLVVALEEFGLDLAELQALPPEDALWAIAKAREERGITQAELDGWTTECDPIEPVDWSSEDCVREKIRAALEEPVSVPRTLLYAAIGGFAVAAAAIWLRKK